MRPKEFDLDTVADSAMLVFWRNGYAATSIQDLVEGTGLGRSSLYNTFGSKHGLYEYVLKRYQESKKKNIEILSAPGSVKGAIRCLLEEIVNDELNDISHKGCMTANAALELAGRDPSIAAIVNQNFQQIESALETAIIRGQNQGEIDSKRNAHSLTHFILNNIQGLRVLSKGYLIKERQQVLFNTIEVTIDAI